MRKMGKFLAITLVISGLFLLGGLLADNQMLQEKLIRLHVVANSNSAQDQSDKLAVKDAVISYLQENTAHIQTIADAKEFLEKNLGKIEQVVNQTLEKINVQYIGKVSLEKEKFSARVYETFSLPSGVYNALRIELGRGEGKNWWCVAFPALCMPTTTEDFHATAVEAGLQENLVETISDEQYEIRFFLLDCLGKIENFFYFP